MTDPSLASLAAVLATNGQFLAPTAPAGADWSAIRLGRVRHDSRLVHPGDLFVARPGQRVDGHAHASDAVAAGAVAVLAERPVADLGVPLLVVSDAHLALAIAAAWRVGDPSRRMGVVGITGTDGKTTTAYLVRAILEAAGSPSGLIGTTDVIVGGESRGNAARATTPEAPELQGYLADMLAAGDRWAIVESTSHGLAQQRVGAIAYDIAVLTNVTAEHLEFHGTLEAYREAKRMLFRKLAVGPGNPDKGFGKHAIVNLDDAVAELFGQTARADGADVIGYGLDAALGGSTTVRPDLAATSLREDPSGMHVSVVSDEWRGELHLRLAGRFNIHNALAALGVARALRLDLDAAVEALASVAAVPGRMQRVDRGQPFTVVIDYAHTAESLGKVLDELAPAAPGSGLIAVFGSAGDRDTHKRAVMGRVAGERCRLVVITDEDPRTEDRYAILDAIASGAESAGMRRGDDLLVIADRAEAIAAAIAAARPGDAVLLAGKGHERTIETASGAQPWDEAAAAYAALAAVGYG